MSFSFSPFGIFIGGPDGSQPFSTDIPKFHVMDEIAGDFFFPGRVSDYNTHYNFTGDNDVCACDPFATIAVGAVKFSGTSGVTSCINDTDWWMWNGSLVVYYDFSTANSGGHGYTSSVTRLNLSTWMQITPICSAGRLIFREKTFIRGIQSSPATGIPFSAFSRPAFTLSYVLQTGTFT